MKMKGFDIDQALLDYVVSSNNKKRFAFNSDHTRIRASQGHSVAVNLGYQSKEPPAILYHGTAKYALVSILKTGLDKRSRHHVHLTANESTALSVGTRYGDPVILQIDALLMHTEGCKFYESENHVWLTDNVPVKYIKVIA